MTVAIDNKFGAWVVIGIDAAGKRAGCRCACGRVQTISVAALEDGSSRSCGCQPPPRAQRAAFRAEIERRRRRRDWQS